VWQWRRKPRGYRHRGSVLSAGGFFFHPTVATRPSPEAVKAPQRPEPAGTPGAPQQKLALTTLGKDGAEMLLVPAGEFIMGSAPDEVASLVRSNRKANGAIRQDEIPRHRVSLEAFYIDKYEVTNARFQQFVQATGYRTQAEREAGQDTHWGEDVGRCS